MTARNHRISKTFAAYPYLWIASCDQAHDPRANKRSRYRAFRRELSGHWAQTLPDCSVRSSTCLGANFLTPSIFITYSLTEEALWATPRRQNQAMSIGSMCPT